MIEWYSSYEEAAEALTAVLADEPGWREIVFIAEVALPVPVRLQCLDEHAQLLDGEPRASAMDHPVAIRANERQVFERRFRSWK